MGWYRRTTIAAAAAVAISAAACSLLTDLGGLTTSDGGTDAAADSTPNVDARSDADAAPGCDPLAPFTSVTPLGGVSSAGVNEFKPTLSADELEIWLGVESDAGAYLIESATRSAIDASFGPTSPDLNLDITGDNADPTASDDVLTIVFSRRPGQVGGWDLFGATRASRSVGFDPPSPLVNVQSVGDEIAPFLAADGSLYFASNRGADFDIFVAAPSGNGFAAPVAVTELDSTSDETGIVVTRDGLWAYVESSRGDLSIGGEDILLAHRAVTSDPFGPLQPVSEVNTVFQERATWISPDNCRLYFESNRSGGGLPRDIFVASKSP